MPPVFKMLMDGTAYRTDMQDVSRSNASIRGVVTGLPNTSAAWQLAITTAQAAMASAPATGYPILRWESRVFRIGTGTDGIAIVDGYFGTSDSQSAGGGSGLNYNKICDVTVGVYEYRTCEATPFDLHVGNVGALVDAKFIAGAISRDGSYPAKALNRRLHWRSFPLPEWSIRIPIEVTLTPIGWSTGLIWKLNSNVYSLGDYLFQPGTLRHDGVAMTAYSTDGGVTYIFRANVVYTARPVKCGGNYLGFINIIGDESGGGDIKASSELLFENAVFTNPPGV